MKKRSTEARSSASCGRPDAELPVKVFPKQFGDGHAALGVLQDLDDLRLAKRRRPPHRSLPEQSTGRVFADRRRSRIEHA